MKLKIILKNILLAAVLVITNWLPISVLAEQTTVIDNGISYNLYTVTGTYASLASQLQQTPWWLNPSLAGRLTIQVLAL